jgi:hypothetical protein
MITDKNMKGMTHNVIIGVQAVEPEPGLLCTSERFCDNLVPFTKNEGYYLHLNGHAESKSFEFTCCYNPIGRI